MPGPAFLTGDRVALRPIEVEDAEFFTEVLNDPEVRWGLSRSHPITRGREEDWIEAMQDDEDNIPLLVSVDGERAGNVALHGVDHRIGTAELGYFMAPAFQGEGYMTEATELMVSYAFDELGLHRLTVRAFETNVGSQRVIEKVGFSEAGRFRESAIVDGDRVDVLLFDLLAEEFEG